MLGLSHPSKMWFGIHPDWIYGEKEKIIFNFGLLGFLLSKSTWVCNKKTNPSLFPLLYTGTEYLVANRWSTGRLGHERFSISTLSLCGPESDIECSFPFCLLTHVSALAFLGHWCWSNSQEAEGWQGLCLNHQLTVLPLAHLEWPTWNWSLGLRREALKESSVPLSSSCFHFPYLEVKSQLYTWIQELHHLLALACPEDSRNSPSGASVSLVTLNQNSCGCQKNGVHNLDITTS